MLKVKIKKFQNMVPAIGSDNITAIKSGPRNHPVKFLQDPRLSLAPIVDKKNPSATST